MLKVLALIFVFTDGAFACGRGGIGAFSASDYFILFVFFGMIITSWTVFAFKFKRYRYWNFISFFYEMVLMILILGLIKNTNSIFAFFVIQFSYWGIVSFFWNLYATNSTTYKRIVVYKMKVFFILEILMFILIRGV